MVNPLVMTIHSGGIIEAGHPGFYIGCFFPLGVPMMGVPEPSAHHGFVMMGVPELSAHHCFV